MKERLLIGFAGICLAGTLSAQVVIQSGGGRVVLVSPTSGKASVLGAKTLSTAEASTQDGDDLEVKIPPLDKKVADELDRMIAAGRPSIAAIDALLRASDLAHGMLVPVLKRLDPALADQKTARTAHFIAAHARRVMGDVAGALGLLEKLVDTATGPLDYEEQKLYAELLDQSNRILPAIVAYSQLASMTTDPAVRASLELRIALMRKLAPIGVFRAKGDVLEAAFGTTDGRPIESLYFDPLLEIAGLSSPEEKQRLAFILALVGDPKSATELVGAAPSADEYRTSLRRTEWALRAKDVPAARKWAMDAVKKAPMARDRRYALSALVETYRQGDELGKLADLLAKEPAPTTEEQEVWIELLRTLERVDEALATLKSGKTAAGFPLTPAMRQGLLDICIVAGKDDEVIALYRSFADAEPENVAWRLGLAKWYVDKGRFADAENLWRAELARRKTAGELIDGAKYAADLGLETLFPIFIERAMALPEGLAQGALHLADFHLDRGRPAEAEKVLVALEPKLDPGAPQRLDLAEALEHLGKKAEAVKILEKIRALRFGEDLEMKLGWLYSEVGREEEALKLWMELWRKVQSVPRRGYVEDRILNVASRLGKIADIAIDLEQRLDKGQGDELDRGLLVKLYTKANDPVSAAEILDDFGKKSGKPIEALRAIAQVYFECNDFLNYEITMRRLIEEDKENAPDLMRQLAMSALERARPDVARTILKSIVANEQSTDAEEFEAGILSLAELRDESTAAYRKAIAKWPDHIEAYLLLANDLVAMGKQNEAIGIFQHLTMIADKDDLFGVAVDGLMNVEADQATLRWAMRLTMERMAKNSERMHLYLLMGDLADAVNDKGGAQRAVEEALPLAGERRLPMLRELMDLAGEADRDSLVRYGRRVVALGEQVPPDVFLDLGQAFLAADDAKTAMRTFGLARDIPDHNAFEKKVAGAFETAGQKPEALRVYERILKRQPTDVALLSKIGELNEELGRVDAALALYDRAMDLMLLRRPFREDKVQKKPADDEDDFYGWGGQNTDSYDEHAPRVRAGTIACRTGAVLEAFIARESQKVMADLEQAIKEKSEAPKDQYKLSRYPRLRDRADYLRKSAFGFGRPELVGEIDAKIVSMFTDDKDLLETLTNLRLDHGYLSAARRLIEQSDRPEAEKTRLFFLVGVGNIPEQGEIKAEVARRMMLPLLSRGDTAALDRLVKRIVLPAIEKEDLQSMPPLVLVALHVGDADSALTYARRWFQAAAKFQQNYQLQNETKRIFGTVWSAFPRDYTKALAEEVASTFIGDPKKFASLADTLCELQRELKVELLPAKSLDDLFKSMVKSDPWELVNILNFLPIDQRIEKFSTLVNEVEADSRLYFIMNFVRASDEKIPEKHWEALTSAFMGAIAGKKAEEFHWQVNSILGSKKNPEFALNLLAKISEQYPNESSITLAYASALSKAGEKQKAIELGASVLTGILGNSKPHDYQQDNALSMVTEIFGKAELETMMTAINRFEETANPTVTSIIARANIYQSWDYRAKVIQTLTDGLGRFPKTATLVQRLMSQYQSMGREFDAIDLQTELASLYNDRPYMSVQLKSAWTSLGNPIRANQVVVKDSRFASRAEGTAAIKEAVEAGDMDRARAATRRHLRQFGNEYAYRYGGLYVDSSWPSETAAAKPGDGIPAEFKEEKKAEKSTSTTKTLFDVLVDLPFGEEELETFVRLVPAAYIDSQMSAVSALAKARAKRIGFAPMIDEILAKVKEGRAGKVEFAMLIDQLGQHPEIAAKVGTIIDDFLRTAPASSGDTVTRLASLAAKVGRGDDTLRLFRWGIRLKVAEAAENPWSLGYELRNILTEVKNEVPAEYRAEILRYALDLAKASPLNQNEYSFSNGFDSVVLRLSAEVLGPEKTLETYPEILKRTLELTENYARAETCLIISGLYAKVGKLDDAEKFLHAMTDGKENSWNFSYVGIADLLPRLSPEWKEGRAWYERVEKIAADWTESGKLPGYGASTFFACVALRKKQAGDADGMQSALARARAACEKEDTNRTWMIDVMRYCGMDGEAFAMERALLRENRLNSRRIPAVIAKMIEDGEIEEAFRIGEYAAEYSPRVELLKSLITAAEKLGKQDRVKYWKEIGRKVAPKDKVFEG